MAGIKVANEEGVAKLAPDHPEPEIGQSLLMEAFGIEGRQQPAAGKDRPLHDALGKHMRFACYRGVVHRNTLRRGADP